MPSLVWILRRPFAALIGAAVVALFALATAPVADAQLAICTRVSPPPSYCGEDEPPPPPPPLPAAPPTDLVMAANTSSSITLAWTDNATNENGFTIDQVVDGYWKPLTRVAANPGTGRMSTTIGDLPSNTTYRYRVSASPGSLSSGPMLDVATRPEAPRDVKASASPTTISVWSIRPPSADRLIAELRRDAGSGPGPLQASALVKPWASGHLFENLSPSTRYCVTITSESPGGRSPSEPVCLQTHPAPPPPAPPEIVHVAVPQTIGATFLEAVARLRAAKLDVGKVTAPPGAYYYGDLPVVEQTPSSGTKVPEGTAVDLRVEWRKVTGVKAVKLLNLHAEGRTVRIYTWDGSQWTDAGDLPYNQSKTVSLISARVSTIVAVDRGLINCNDGRPDNVSCQRMAAAFVGDSAGNTAEASVR